MKSRVFPNISHAISQILLIVRASFFVGSDRACAFLSFNFLSGPKGRGRNFWAFWAQVDFFFRFWTRLEPITTNFSPPHQNVQVLPAEGAPGGVQPGGDGQRGRQRRHAQQGHDQGSRPGREIVIIMYFFKYLRTSNTSFPK